MNFGERDDKLHLAIKIHFLTCQDEILKVPGKQQKIVRIILTDRIRRYNGNKRSWSKFAELERIYSYNSI
ncbi:hypothetical protein RS9917_04625 [Synechococcus sp. RS9917]|nr:hypothetical protein RS9917_04625 [Synechococcus sp. RS9917]